MGSLGVQPGQESCPGPHVASGGEVAEGLDLLAAELLAVVGDGRVAAAAPRPPCPQDGGAGELPSAEGVPGVDDAPGDDDADGGVRGGGHGAPSVRGAASSSASS